jgi:predicted  nucleic acid-binding Zn-ribbon protein
MKQKIDAATEAKAAELVALLSNPDDYARWLSEMRSVISNADFKLAELAKAEAKSANAERLLRDAESLLAKQSERETALIDKESDLRERAEQLSAQINDAMATHTRQQADLATRSKLLDARVEHLDRARKLVRDGLQRLRDEWSALKQVGADVEALGA